MNLFLHILLISMPVIVIANSDVAEVREPPKYIMPRPVQQIDKNYNHFLPKSECNFDNSSIIASKKVKYFAYDCAQPSNNWLLIHTSEANYYDVLR